MDVLVVTYLARVALHAAWWLCAIPHMTFAALADFAGVAGSAIENLLGKLE